MRTARLIRWFGYGAVLGLIVFYFTLNNTDFLATVTSTRTVAVPPPWTRNAVESNIDILNTKISTEQVVVAKPTAAQRSLRIFCMVKTQPANFVSKAQIVKDTWGKRCDKLLFISTLKNDTLPVVQVIKNQRESRQLLAQKVFAGLRHIYAHYVEAYDWFMVCDDDTYVIVENLRLFLSDKNSSEPVYYGHRFMKYTPQGYSSGGSGYVMSQESLRRIGERGNNYSECDQKGTGSDFKVGQCLYKLGVLLKNSTDSKGRSRFHCFDVRGHLIGPYPNWYILFTKNADGSRINDISDFPISFHYSAGGKMLALEFLLYRARVWGRGSNEHLNTQTLNH